MKILHTSDWHLDCRLFNQKRTEEHKAFLDWLRDTIIQRQTDVLIVSGDIFDNRTPTLESQNLYMQFITALVEDRLAGKSACRCAVIVGGNHDSPAFLEVTKPIFKYLNITVAARKPEIVVVKPEKNGEQGLIIAAMPFLSDMDLRKSVEGENAQEKSLHLMEGIRDAYKVCEKEALEKKAELQSNTNVYIPLVATGHLFAQGGTCVEGENAERDIYVGNIEKFPAGDFPESFDYIALGHLHVPQKVGSQDRIQYSGSPLPIGFGEAAQNKQIIEVEWDKEGKQIVTTIPVPKFQNLVQISGAHKAQILEKVKALIEQNQTSDSSVWLEVLYKGKEHAADFLQCLTDTLKDSRVILLAFRCESNREQTLTASFKGESLKTLNPAEVFQRTLDSLNIPKDKHEELIALFAQIQEEL